MTGFLYPTATHSPQSPQLRMAWQCPGADHEATAFSQAIGIPGDGHGTDCRVVVVMYAVARQRHFRFAF